MRPVSKDDIREIFMRNGFTIKEGQDDLKPYVFAAAYDLLIFAHGETKPNIDHLLNQEIFE
jgi:hypothetical protein